MSIWRRQGDIKGRATMMIASEQLNVNSLNVAQLVRERHRPFGFGQSVTLPYGEADKLIHSYTFLQRLLNYEYFKPPRNCSRRRNRMSF